MTPPARLYCQASHVVEPFAFELIDLVETIEGTERDNTLPQITQSTEVCHAQCEQPVQGNRQGDLAISP